MKFIKFKQKNKSIGYISIEKIASTSILRTLINFSKKNGLELLDTHPNNPGSGIIKDCKDLFTLNYIFAYVRNPYNRFISSYILSCHIYEGKRSDWDIDKYLSFLEKSDLKNCRPGMSANPNVSLDENVILIHSLPATYYLEDKNNIINSQINIYKLEDENSWNIVRNNFLTIFEKKLDPLIHINSSKK